MRNAVSLFYHYEGHSKGNDEVTMKIWYACKRLSYCGAKYIRLGPELQRLLKLRS